MEFIGINGKKYNKYKLLSAELCMDDEDSGGSPYIKFIFGYSTHNATVERVYFTDDIRKYCESRYPDAPCTTAVQGVILKDAIEYITVGTAENHVDAIMSAYFSYIGDLRRKGVINDSSTT